jgi:hypothetical protein
MAKKVKVAGYSQKTVYNGNIEYRNFDPDLVGLQFAANGGNSLFTAGNFNITTNLDPKLDKNFITGNYTNFFTLDNLNLTVEQSQQLLETNTKTVLNLNNTNLKNYALFGSMTEYIRISLENIITNWPASLYVMTLVNIDGIDYNVNTYDNYVYDSLHDTSTFRVNTNYISNPYQLNYLTNGTIIDTFNEANDLRNLTVNYDSYVILNDDTEYQVLEFTGSTNILNDFIYFKVKGNPFTGNVTTNNINFHIKPNKTIENTFFNNLSGIEKFLLNREIIPKYTATFEYPIRTESGIIMYTEKSVTWPVLDGYNIDFGSESYANYATSLLEVTNNYDLNETSLMNRFLVSESISAFDTVPVRLAPEHEDTTTGQKVNKTLNIYGRSFDDLNQFIEGISLAHTVTYNKQDNVPDKYLKDLAKVLGWDLVNVITNGNLLNNYVDYSDSSFSGYSIGLTPAETDLELWRRIILNTPWIWKSKGARKSIEFLLSFMSIPKGLITFNEYIYRAKAPINLDVFTSLLEANGLDVDLNNYPVDNDGYPKPLPNSDTMYYQGNGQWFRQTGGSGSTIDILLGNNPHAGPYDGGSAYINQFRKLIPNFSATTLETTTEKITESNLFLNYNEGEITNYNGEAYVDIVNQDNSDISQCIVYKAEFIKDPMPTAPTTECGCPCDGDDDILSVCLDKNNSKEQACNGLINTNDFEDTGYLVGQYYLYDKNNQTIGRKESVFINKECCTALGGKSTILETLWKDGLKSSDVSMNTTGLVCCVKDKCGCSIACDWTIIDRTLSNPTVMAPIQIPENSGNYFIKFRRAHGNGLESVVTVDGANCPTKYTIPISGIIDPFTNEVGFGCRLTQFGLNDINKNGSELLKIFEARRLGTLFPDSRGTIGCCDVINFSKSLYE